MPELYFFETAMFKKWVRKNRLRPAVDLLKDRLIENLDLGDVIPGSGGLRKVRMAVPGRGKRGGARVIYVLVVDRRGVGFIDAYTKSEQSNVDADDLARLMAGAAILEQIARNQIPPESES